MNEILKEIEARYADAWKEFKVLNDKFLDPNYDEEFQDTILRNYSEGYADALRDIIHLIAEQEA